MKMRGDRRNKELLAQGIRGIYRGSLTGDGQRVTTSYDDAMDVLRHVAQGREAAVNGELIWSDPSELGTVAEIIYWPKLIHGSVTPSVIRSTRARIETAAARIAAERLSAAVNCVCGLN